MSSRKNNGLPGAIIAMYR